MQNDIRLLSTNILDEALVAKAATEQIFITDIPFITTSQISNLQLTETIIALSKHNVEVAFTSQHAVEVVADVVGNVRPDWTVYSLAGATAKTVSNHWTNTAIVATAKNATALALQIIADNVKNLYFFCGNNRRDELPQLLMQHNVAITEIACYETVQNPVHVLEQFDGILFFSPSAVESFFSVNNISTQTLLFAIGQTTADAIKAFSQNTVITSDFPGKENLVEKAAAHFRSITKYKT